MKSNKSETMSLESSFAMNSEVKISAPKTEWGKFLDQCKNHTAKRLDAMIVVQKCYEATLVVFIESFYELLTCTAISVGMLKIRSYWNTSDKISVAYSIFTALILLVFIIMNAYFSFVTSKNLSILHRHRQNEKFSEQLKKARRDHKQKIKDAKN